MSDKNEEKVTNDKPQEQESAPTTEDKSAEKEDSANNETNNDDAGDEEGKVEITEEEIRKMSERVHTLQEESARMEQMVQEMQVQAAPGFKKKAVDERSIYVGNVDYAATPEDIQSLFSSCGIIERVTIPRDHVGKPKGFAYLEFRDKLSVANALELNESLLHGRAIKVLTKRTNFPCMGARRRRRRMPRRRQGYRYHPYY